MDRGRRAEPYSNATIWTREIARNLASHLSRVSKAHSCVDTKSPKSTRLPQFHHSNQQKRCPNSPVKTRQPLVAITQNPNLSVDQEIGLSGSSSREEIEDISLSSHYAKLEPGQWKQELAHRKELLLPHQENDSGAAVNEEILDRPVRIPAVKPPAKYHVVNGNNEVATYDSPLVLPHQTHHLAHDYYKRQEQRKIWQENQALNKRLQSTKSTLNSKEWEKDTKWTQEFLKNKERRRSALQQELRRAQVSPQAVLRPRPLKSLHPHHLKSIRSDSDKKLDLKCSTSKADDTDALSSRGSSRRGSKGQVVLGSRGNSDATVQQTSAANHRRIMELRKQKPSPSCSTESSTDPAVSNDQAACIQDDEIVAVRFTFSRGRSRGSESSTSGIEPAEQLHVEALKVYGHRDMMSLSGAFSPGVELESALNDVAVNDTEDTEHHAQVAAKSTMESTDLQVGAEKRSSTPQLKPDLSQSDEGEEVYDGDNFDDDALPSSRATHEPVDKHEASGYASEFEEDPGTTIHTANTTATVNQKEEEDEEEYSHDEFE